MKTEKLKQNYEAPGLCFMDMMSECVLCASGQVEDLDGTVIDFWS